MGSLVETSKTETTTIDTQICDINKKIYTKTMKFFVILCTVSPLMSAPQYGQSGGGHNSIPSLQPPASASQSVACRTEQQVIWDTKYIETETQECAQISVPKCSTAYKKQCNPVQRQQCNQVYKNECSTQYQQQCGTQYREETEYYTETECNTDYKEDCEYQWEGTGNNKVWAPIPGTCNNNAYDRCGDVQKQKLKQVPYNDCQQVPYQNCQNVPQQQCKPVHKKVPQRISKRVPKKVCDGGSGSGYSRGSNSGFNGGFGGTGGFRNSEVDAGLLSEKQVDPDAEVLFSTDKQVKVNARDKDAVNFGR